MIAEPSKADVVSRALHAIGRVADSSEGRHLDDRESSTMLSVSSGEAHVDEDPMPSLIYWDVLAMESRYRTDATTVARIVLCGKREGPSVPFP